MISAVAELYKLHPQTLRLYERVGLLKPSRSQGNTRLYTDSDLERLEVILTLTREMGVNLAGIHLAGVVIGLAESYTEYTLNGGPAGFSLVFAVILVGQPMLRQRLRLGVLAALDQRIAVRYSIAGMNGTDTADYIRHHCKIAGRSDTLFSDDAIGLIHNASRGHPRAINNLALHSLTAAFAADHAIVDEKAARIAIAEIAAD